MATPKFCYLHVIQNNLQFLDNGYFETINRVDEILLLVCSPIFSWYEKNAYHYETRIITINTPLGFQYYNCRAHLHMQYLKVQRSPQEIYKPDMMYAFPDKNVASCARDAFAFELLTVTSAILGLFTATRFMGDWKTKYGHSNVTLECVAIKSGPRMWNQSKSEHIEKRDFLKMWKMYMSNSDSTATT